MTNSLVCRSSEYFNYSKDDVENLKITGTITKYDENGNISQKFFSDSEEWKPEEGQNYINFVISQQLEIMSKYFPSDCVHYAKKLLYFQNISNDWTYDDIRIFINVFMRCVKYCLDRADNDFNILCKLRKNIVSVLTFLNTIEDDYTKLKSYECITWVIFGLLFDIELLSTSYRVEETEIVKNRLLKEISRFLRNSEAKFNSIFYSSEFIDANRNRSYKDICVPILKEVLEEDVSTSSETTFERTLVYKLWKMFSEDSDKNMIMTKNILEGVLDEKSGVYTSIMSSHKNNSIELVSNGKCNIVEMIKEFLKKRETLLKIDYTIPEIPLSRPNEHNYSMNEESETDATLKIANFEHDYCRSKLENKTAIFESLENISCEELEKESDDECQIADEEVEIELCDLCVELETLAIDSYLTEPAECDFRSTNTPNHKNENESYLYLTDTSYRLHYETCEADENCFTLQYEYITLSKRDLNIDFVKLPSYTFSEDGRCQCLPCHNNFESLKKNWIMLTKYARERAEKIRDLTSSAEGCGVDLDPKCQCLASGVSECKRSANDTVECKLPLKKRKFSVDNS